MVAMGAMACTAFRSTTVADEPAIRGASAGSLRHSTGAPDARTSHLYWKYWEPRAGWQGSRSYILTQDDRILAHAAVVPAVFSFGNDRLQVLQVIDWAARAQARGAGNTLMQYIGTLGDAIITWSGTDRAWRLLPFLGFAESNTVVTLYARPIHPLLMALESVREIIRIVGGKLAAAGRR